MSTTTSTIKLRREGNLRFLCQECTGYPEDPQAIHEQILATAATAPVDCYGPVTIWFDHEPDDHSAPGTWPCRIGSAITGLFTFSERHLLVEDYRQLVSIADKHLGPIAELAQTYRLLCSQAASKGLRLRPYWRVQLRRQLLADGNLLPLPEVSIFVDQA